MSSIVHFFLPTFANVRLVKVVTAMEKTVNTHNSSLEGAMKLKFAPFCSS